MKLPSCSMKSSNLSPCIPAVMNSSQVHTICSDFYSKNLGQLRNHNVLLELEAMCALSQRSKWQVVSPRYLFLPKSARFKIRSNSPMSNNQHHSLYFKRNDLEHQKTGIGIACLDATEFYTRGLYANQILKKNLYI